jgi:hypothetical protein
MNTEILNSPAARAIFRKHHIIATGTAAVRRGYELKGDHFMYDLVKALSPAASVLNGNYGEGDETGPPTFQQWTEQNPAATTATGKGWKFWDNLLINVGRTGETISQFKRNALATPETNTPADQPATTSKSSYLIYGLALVVLALVVYLIVKNKNS